MNLSHDLEHQFWKTLKTFGLAEKNEFLLAISGGLDSIVLLELFAVVKPHAKLILAHYHHGDTSENAAFRNQAAECIRKRAEASLTMHLMNEKSEKNLKSEDDMRRARWEFLRRIRPNGTPIVTAHHQDDWVETLTLKLIRGTSAEGLSQFQVWNQEIFRPLLLSSKLELKEYADVRKLIWIEDPSNKDRDFLRNWLRESWFPDLEKRVPGGYKSFSRSLINLGATESSFQIEFYKQLPALGLDRVWFMTLSSSDQLKALASFLKIEKTFSFTRGQLEEIQKRIDKNQNEITFEILRKWVINATQIMVT